MPLQATSGAASYDAFGGGAPSEPNYIESVFQTYLYSGTGAAQTITNGIDLSGKGGLTWIKIRDDADSHILTDTVRGVNSQLKTNTTGAAQTELNRVTSFTSTGFVLGVNTDVNQGGVAPVRTYASWTFRKQPKFFDVVTWTGNNVDGRDISHSLGSSPGFVVIKCTSSSTYWVAKHKDALSLTLNTTNAQGGSANTTNGYVSSVSSTSFNVVAGLTDLAAVNASGQTYVAYLFAHNAGGFGLTGTDNVISCGSVTADGSGSATVNLGYEPQWLLVKSSSEANSWAIVDTMRGLPADGLDRLLFPNNSNAESGGGLVNINATGFYANATLSASATYIYIAIRRGPMKVPTSGTSVFSNNLETSSTNPQTLTTGFPVDLSINTLKNVNSTIRYVLDRLRGSSVSSGVFLQTNGTNAETATSGLGFQNNTGLDDNGWWNTSGAIFWNFRRAPSFFDEVCYTGTGSATTFSHNLGVAPELMIVKNRSSAGYGWVTYSATLGATKYLQVNSTAAEGTVSTYWNNTAPTSSVFSVGTAGATNASGNTFVAHLFATCAGVSKVGSYTGTGATQTIDCGFTGGARFVLIKRTDSTGDWYVWDSARGMVSGTDPSLLLNSTAAEVNANSVYAISTGFQIVTTAAGINASGGTYIFLRWRNMTAQELLDMQLDGKSTLFDVFNSHLIEGQFGDVEDEQEFFLKLSQKIIDAVKT